MVVDDYNKGSLSDIEISAHITNAFVPDYSAHMFACIPESHPAFNTDLWCNNIDWIERDGYQRFVYGGDDVISFLKANFPHVIDYYSKHI